MKTYKVIDIVGTFGLFLEDEIETEDVIDAKEQIMLEICANVGNYVEIELEEVTKEKVDDYDVIVEDKFFEE